MEAESHNTIDTSTQTPQVFTETGQQQNVNEGFWTWNTLSNVANSIEVITFFLTIWTLVTVRKYKSQKVNAEVIKSNLAELKQLLQALRKYQRNPEENPIASDTLNKIKVHVNKIKSYGRKWNRITYYSEFKTIKKATEINGTSLSNIINDLDIIIKVGKND